MPPKKRAVSPSVSPSKKPRLQPTAWSSAEDALIVQLRNTKPPKSWAEITAAVNALPAPAPRNRNTPAVRMHYTRQLQGEGALNFSEPLTEHEKSLLKKAVLDVESMSDKWWFVAARYTELRKAKGEAREMGKVGVRKWWEVVKDDQNQEGKGKGKGKDAPEEDEEDEEEKEEVAAAARASEARD
ncbi:hypothetical protein K440DRAFT_633000 [Wilcoxina mikolae CBS 423.85]|nr:hypothetical protein K440DRAFT_633000 [Wilcoxina mikolae CBS 423.85]